MTTFFPYTLILIGFGFLLNGCSGGGSSDSDNDNDTGSQSLQSIVFRSEAAPDFQTDLYAIKEDGSNPTPLAVSSDDEFLFDRLAQIEGGPVIFSRFSNLTRSDIFGVSLDGTGLVSLASHPEDDEPILTTQGVLLFKRLGVTNDLFAVNLDGTGLLNLDTNIDEQAFVTSLGQVVYSKQGDVWSINLDASNLTALSTAPEAESVVGISTSGRVIFQRTVTSSQFDLYSVNPDGTELIPLAATSDPEILNFVKGDLVIYLRRKGITNDSDLYLVNADGTNTVPLATGSKREFANAITASERMVYTEVVTEPRAGISQNADIHSVNLDGSGRTSLASESADESFIGLSSDDRVVFLRIIDHTTGDLYSVQPDGAQLTLLAGNILTFPILMTDEATIVFHRDTTGTNTDAFIINSDGSGLIPVASGPKSEVVTQITANGRLILEVFNENIANDPNLTDLYSVTTQGTDLVPLAISANDEYEAYLF